MSSLSIRIRLCRPEQALHLLVRLGRRLTSALDRLGRVLLRLTTLLAIIIVIILAQEGAQPVLVSIISIISIISNISMTSSMIIIL